MFKKSFNARLYLIFVFFILCFTLLITRLVYVQIVKSSQLKTLASEQHSIFTEMRPQRGIIFDRNLKELAVNTISYSIFASHFPRTKEILVRGKFVPTEKVIEQVATLLKLDRDILAEKLNSDKSFTWLKRKVSPEVSLKVKDLNIAGINQAKEYKRFYPNGNLASHIVGFTNIDSQGLEGVELFNNSYLSGLKGWRLSQRDAKRREVVCWGYKSIAPTDGYNLVLTIDSVIQNIVEKHMRRAVRRHKVASATAIVIHPKTGEILALYNYPDFDLNNYADYEVNVRRNLAITDIYEPGSSFKFVTAAAAIEENQIKLEDKLYCEKGKYRVGGRILHDFRPYGELSFKEVVEHSSNIGIVKVAETLGERTLYKYIRDFGFGSLTGIDLPGEVKGILRAPEMWSKISISSIPIGQEVAVTAIQQIVAISCIANDGILVKPKILLSIQDKDGKITKSFPNQKKRKVVSVETARILKQVLTGVVENGTGKRAKVSGYKVAGKTGTAQKAKPQGGYYRNKYVSTFVGFVPAEEPLISILIVLNEPSGVYFGGRVCAPIFREIATETLRYIKMSNEATTNEIKGIN